MTIPATIPGIASSHRRRAACFRTCARELREAIRRPAARSCSPSTCPNGPCGPECIGEPYPTNATARTQETP
jgi:hypothetical protein